MRQLVSFQKLKLTNNHLDPFGHVSITDWKFILAAFVSVKDAAFIMDAILSGATLEDQSWGEAGQLASKAASLEFHDSSGLYVTYPCVL